MRADIAKRKGVAVAHAPQNNRLAEKDPPPQLAGPQVAAERGEVPQIAQEQRGFRIYSETCGSRAHCEHVSAAIGTSTCNKSLSSASRFPPVQV